jgi:SPP1 family predicted phage head-tail adaptor
MTLDRLIQFRRATLSDDGFGMVETWEDHGGPIMAGKRDASDAERFRAGEVQAHITTRFTVRWSPFTVDITPKDRLVTEDGREYDITGIKEIGTRYTFLEITASARAD